MIDTRDGKAALSDFLPDRPFPNATLLDLSGDRSVAEPDFKSGLALRLAEAWMTPVSALTCGHFRILVSQRRGLPWIGALTADFVARYPDAECDLFPGDLTMAALTSWRALFEIAPTATRAMLAADMRWLAEEALAESPQGLATRAARALAEARAFVGECSVVKP